MGTDLTQLPDYRHGGFCLYTLTDPRTQEVFYVGKCKNARMRAWTHLKGSLPKHQPALAKRLCEMRGADIEPEFSIVAEIKFTQPWRWRNKVAMGAERSLIHRLASRYSLVNVQWMPCIH